MLQASTGWGSEAWPHLQGDVGLPRHCWGDTPPLGLCMCLETGQEVQGWASGLVNLLSCARTVSLWDLYHHSQRTEKARMSLPGTS